MSTDSAGEELDQFDLESPFKDLGQTDLSGFTLRTKNGSKAKKSQGPNGQFQFDLLGDKNLGGLF